MTVDALIGLVCAAALTACGARVTERGPGCDAGAPLQPTRRSLAPSDRIEWFPECGSMNAPAAVARAWEGTFDDYALRSGSRRIRIEFSGGDDVPGAVCGTVTFGDGPAPPLPTDPEAAPPGTFGVPEAPGNTFLDYTTEPVEGFAYQFYAQYDLGLHGDRVRFLITTTQPFKAWCEMQWSYPPYSPLTRGVGFNCIPETGVFSIPSDAGASTCMIIPGIIGTGEYRGSRQSISCARMNICFERICSCGTPGCTANLRPDVPIDLHVESGALVGSIVWKYTVLPVHLTRAR